MNFYKMWSLWTAVVVVLTGSAQAEYYDQMQNSGECLFLCPVRPICNPCGNLFVVTDLLIWRSSEDGLGYGKKVVVAPSALLGGAPVLKQEKEKNPQYTWNAGFRIGVGYNSACDGWDVATNWTHFHNRADSSSKSDFVINADGLIHPFYPAWLVVDKKGFIDEVKTNWKFRLDLVDLELGREFYISRSLTLRPFIGLRAARIDQKYHLRGQANEGEPTLGVIQSANFTTKTLMNCEYRGIGLRTGLDSEWSFGCGWSLYGQAAVSLLYGRFNVVERFDFEQRNEAHSSNSPSFNDDSKDRFWASRAITDMALGIRWKKYFDCDCLALTVQLAWEQHLFFAQNQFQDVNAGLSNTILPYRTAGQIHRGDLSVQGITLSCKLDF